MSGAVDTEMAPVNTSSDNQNDFNVRSKEEEDAGALNGVIRDPAKEARDADRQKKKAKRPSKGLEGGSGDDVTALLDEVSGTAAASGGSAAALKSRHSRKPRNGKGRGLPKKGGAGGKGVWGAPGCELDAEDGRGDVNDPNYDSESEEVRLKPVSPEVTAEELEKVVLPLVQEFFEHGDPDDICDALGELNLGDQAARLVVVIVSAAMDRHNPQRELASVLLSELYSAVLEEPDFEDGFTILLNSLDDLVIDTPDAATILGNFIARAVADDCMAPKFVDSFRGKVDSENVINSLERANVLLHMKHGLVRLDNVWGVGGGNRPVKVLKKKIILLLKEYISSSDVKEATRCLVELDVPHFHHELVYEATVLLVEEYSERNAEMMTKLLKSLLDSVIVTQDQFVRGLKRVFDTLNDLSLDVPDANTYCENFCNMLEAAKVLTEANMKELPAVKGRKRFVSEGDGGKIKS